ncbi:precorrin-2 C(20)-methyltransferase [Halosquirtibacter laminarini]|uniref:Precorrin-2 C(20)-methyltransferase n=1 Tax=Halosquirtibacter laminarini TaxID=3374600 RepID=A0AC61NGF6_9BACT|nr:precorrin-2 C(20)-methyltransferase [Prolixibacteraceae bacterium]
MQKFQVYGVALGPGDPELITLKSLRILQEVDKIYAPGSISRKGECKSHSISIMKQLDIDVDKIEVFHISMRFDREETENLYQSVYEKIQKDIEKGLSIAFVSEGDISFYSTFGYLIPRLKADQISYKMLPGVPAFIQAGSSLGIPLTSQSNSLKVLAAVSSVTELDEALENSNTIVIMKFSTIKSVLIPHIIDNYSDLKVYYVEKLGTEEEFVTDNLEIIDKRTKTYFSILIIQK